MRRFTRSSGEFTIGLLLVCLAVGRARADIIVLKNGRQIVASNVTRENGKVHGETPDGDLSLPDSMVERIEKESTNASSGLRHKSAAADLGMETPAIADPTATGPVADVVVHDGSLDRAALARVEAAASAGQEDAVNRAVTAETVASQFELDRGDAGEALRYSERALAFAPSQLALLLRVAYLHIVRGEDAAALDYLERARRLAPDSPDVAKLTGWADYDLNRLPQAVAEWKRAQQLRPDDQVAHALEKVERDVETESNFREGESAHFVLSYDGMAAPGLARAVLEVLEGDFDDISSTLNYTPRQPISVVLYTNQVFADITRAPNWVGALNDGRIRIPVQGLTAVTPEFGRVLKHELAHSFIAQKTQGRAPVWLQEGVAQWIEGQSAANAAAGLVALYDQHEDPSLAALEGSWMSLPKDYAAIAYAWSLATIEGVVAAGGESDVERLLDRMASGQSAESAVEETLRVNYADLNRLTAEYLRHTYLHSSR